MLKESHMFTLLICLCLCSFSSHVLAATTASEHMSSVNTEKTLANPSNASLIQQVMTEFLFTLKRLLTYKILLIVISIAMIYTLYGNGNTPLQQKPSKTRRKNPPNQRQKKHSTSSFGSLHLSERRHQSDSQKGVEGRQSQMTQSKESGTQHQQRSSDGSKEETSKRHQPDIEREGAEIQQTQMAQNRESETQHQQSSSNVSKEEEGPKKPCLSQKKPMNIGTEDSSIPFIQDGQHPGNGWTWITYKGESFWAYFPDSQQGTEGKHRLISRMVRLGNSFIPHPRQDTLWLRPTFYSDSDVAVLATTSKYAYIQSKKLPTNMRKKDPNSYMLHIAYKTCVIGMNLRVKLIKADPIKKKGYVDVLIDEFEYIHTFLLDKARKEGYVSYEVFRERSSFYLFYATPMSFLTRKFVEKRQWTLGELESSKDALKGELVQAIEEWTNTPNYDFIPQIHKVDTNLYEGLLKRMQSLRVPFCNCQKISQLLVSSRDAPLMLFLFWDIFEAIRMRALGWCLALYKKQYSLRDNVYMNQLINNITKVYSNQNEKYLKNLCFELVDVIQQGFFEDGQLYQLYQQFQTEEQRQGAFDDYMLGIQGAVQAFLAKEVFIESPVAIRVQNSQIGKRLS